MLVNHGATRLLFCTIEILLLTYFRILVATRSIGAHLASTDELHVVTGGFNGVGEVTARSFHDTRCRLHRPSNVWHVLPTRDAQVRSTLTNAGRMCVVNTVPS